MMVKVIIPIMTKAIIQSMTITMIIGLEHVHLRMHHELLARGDHLRSVDPIAWLTDNVRGQPSYSQPSTNS